MEPASDRESDLLSFQSIVRRVQANEGDGYSIHMEHISSDRPGDLVDMLILIIET